jgi:FMN phosphatase YigB (HAD superfamily)
MIFNKILFDFDGVLCKDYFYSNLKDSHPEVYKFINESIFGKDSNILNKWMRAEMTADDVNKYISEKTKIDFNHLSDLFVKSVKAMKVDNRLIDLAKTLASNGRKVALVTNNVDVFNSITIKNHNLNEVFPVIINSFDYGVMKHDKNGRLFEITLEKLGESDFSDTLLIDDSSAVRAAFESRGGTIFPFETFEDFEPWMNKNLLSATG